ncbi:MAG TPA: hypothetical protein VMS21_07610, partial [Methylomirabilota bacterium]|nr:hypothetical protein [Methylomirabilota bacterium]
MTPTIPASHSAPAVSRPAQRHAVIDVGTNSVKLLVADISNGIVEPILESSEQTRLGRGFYQTCRLQPDAIRHTATAVAGFAARAREQHVHSLRVFATSAARDASNTDELTRALEHESAVPLEILTGDQEADWVFQGVSTDPKLAGRPLLILDVGGGSTEFILGQGHEKHYRNSFNLGTVRLVEAFPYSDPPTAGERQHLRAWLEDFM